MCCSSALSLQEVILNESPQVALSFNNATLYHYFLTTLPHLSILAIDWSYATVSLSSAYLEINDPYYKQRSMGLFQIVEGYH